MNLVEFNATIDRLSLTKPQLDAIWAKLPAFDLAKAKEGCHYIHRFDLRSGKHYNDVRELPGPNACTLVWTGEWLPFMEDEADEMYKTLRMYDPAALEVTQ